MKEEIREKLNEVIDIILNDYNMENDTRITKEDIDTTYLKDEIIDMVWCNIEFFDC